MPPAVPHQAQAAAPPPPQSPLRIKQDGKFYERLLTKESSAGNLSFRYYWASEPGSVPFVWETQPGTPKDVSGMAAGAVPAITPPPSYLLRHGTGKTVATTSRHERSKERRKGCRLRRIRIGFIAGIFRRLCPMKSWRRTVPPPVKVSSSRSSRWLFSSVATSTDRGNHDHHEDETADRQHESVACGSFRRARPSPWLPRFRSAGDGGWA